MLGVGTVLYRPVTVVCKGAYMTVWGSVTGVAVTRRTQAGKGHREVAGGHTGPAVSTYAEIRKTNLQYIYLCGYFRLFLFCKINYIRKIFRI